MVSQGCGMMYQSLIGYFSVTLLRTGRFTVSINFGYLFVIQGFLVPHLRYAYF